MQYKNLQIVIIIIVQYNGDDHDHVDHDDHVDYLDGSDAEDKRSPAL